MNRPDDKDGSYLRESPYTFEGEVEFLQETVRYVSRRGWPKYVRWFLWLLGLGVGVNLLMAAARAIG